jgi:hypothetical protein
LRVFASELVQSCVALKRLTILVVSLESGTAGLCDGGAECGAVAFVAGVSTRVAAKVAPKQLKLPKSVRSLDAHVGASIAARFQS